MVAIPVPALSWMTPLGAATVILWGGLVGLALDDAIKKIAMLIRSYALGKTSENKRCLSLFLKHISNFR